MNVIKGCVSKCKTENHNLKMTGRMALDILVCICDSCDCTIMYVQEPSESCCCFEKPTNSQVCLIFKGPLIFIFTITNIIVIFFFGLITLFQSTSMLY